MFLVRYLMGRRSWGSKTRKEEAFDYRIFGNSIIVQPRHYKKVLGPPVKNVGSTEPFEGITCWTGEPGSGKTYGMVENSLVLYKLGWDVITNGMGLPYEVAAYHDFKSLTSLLETVRRNKTLILLDEAPMWANSREWQQFPAGFFAKLQQVRKFGYLLQYSAINFHKVDVHLRDQTYWVWACSKGYFTKKFIRRLTVPEELQIAWERPRFKYNVRGRKEVFDAYDSHGLIVAPNERGRSDIGVGYNPQLCITCGTPWISVGERLQPIGRGMGCEDCSG